MEWANFGGPKKVGRVVASNQRRPIMTKKNMTKQQAQQAWTQIEYQQMKTAMMHRYGIEDPDGFVGAADALVYFAEYCEEFGTGLLKVRAKEMLVDYQKARGGKQ